MIKIFYKYLSNCSHSQAGRAVGQFLLLVFVCLHCHAQIINTKPSDISLGPINFNPSAIKQNKIKSILAVIVDKPDGEVIIDKGATQGYEFDSLGNVTRYYYTIFNLTQNVEIEVPEIIRHGKVIRHAGTRTITKYVNDTISVNVFYDQQNRIVSKRVHSGDYYDTYYYEYTTEGRIKKETHCKETNISENQKEFKLGVQSILSSETFEYTALTPTQLKKSCLNDEGREYKKAIINYDAKGNKLSENYEFIVSWMREETAYTYDENNRLTEKTFNSNESGNIKTESYYEYNSKGALLGEKKLKSDVLTDEINLLYDEAFNLPKSEVNRDHINSSIGIVKFGYAFYN